MIKIENFINILRIIRIVENANAPRRYISLLQNYIEDYLNEIAKKPNSRYVKNSIVRLNSQEDLGILKYKNSDSSDLRVSPALRVGVGDNQDT